MCLLVDDALCADVARHVVALEVADAHAAYARVDELESAFLVVCFPDDADMADILAAGA